MKWGKETCSLGLNFERPYQLLIVIMNVYKGLNVKKNQG